MKKHVILMVMMVVSIYTTGFGQTVESPTEKQMQALEKLMAPQRKKVADILKANDPNQYQRYLNDLEALAQSETSERRKALKDKLERDHYAFIKKGYKAAVINHEEQRRAVAGILGHTNFQLDEFGGISSSSFLPIGPIPLRFEEEKHCPFEIAEEECNHVLLGFCIAKVTTCNINVESTSMYDGGCRSKGYLGDKFTPQANYQKMTVNAEANLSFEGIAVAFGGYSQANVKIGLRLKGPGYNQHITLQHHWCVAPVIWYAKFEGDQDHAQLQAVFNGNFSGGNALTAQVFHETFALAVPLLQAGDAECRSSVNHIRVVAAE